ncbi:MAG: exodeoxyribonuclease VII large subunit [Gammaproteobacteria bacterium]|nr:exodeoxyribonuclease VII large subunit [Gammaproteobacteria bacterium]MDH3466175.1 exodeoxyribonuclease VII large subunit [Gammaproteobacteria bacterium]
MHDELLNQHGAAPARRTFSVTELSREVRLLLESGFPDIWVEGEISNLATPASGHLYFTLKDANSQVRCALFRNRHVKPNAAPADGLQVLVRGRLSLYERRGDFQLIATYLEHAGEGALRRAFELLKRKLEAEGIFDPAHKQPLPKFPDRVGVISSASGAALRDVLSTLRRRFPALAVQLFPVAVQGTAATQQIIDALQLAERVGSCDLLLLVRGGGSLEDLAAFNSEAVAQAIYACGIPIVTGVGHETDFTIADFAADCRAPTPTAAAELASPDGTALWHRLCELQARLIGIIERPVQSLQQRVDWLSRRLGQVHPQQQLTLRRRRLGDLSKTQRLLIDNLINTQRRSVTELTARLAAQNPFHRIAQLQLRRIGAARALARAGRSAWQRYRYRLSVLETHLTGASPSAILERGYAIIRDPRRNIIVRRTDQVAVGDRVAARLAVGELRLQVVDESAED